MKRASLVPKEGEVLGEYSEIFSVFRQELRDLVVPVYQLMVHMCLVFRNWSKGATDVSVVDRCQEMHHVTHP